MIRRPFWIKQVENGWRKRSLVWLSGVRRVGKTTLAKMFEDAVYLNCDLPSVQRRLVDPESFYETQQDETKIIFDEIHRLEDPSIVLKIATDNYPHLKILATGSSTLWATRKFRDALTGRKVSIYMPPILWTECHDVFGIKSLDRRLLRGGLPEPFLADEEDLTFFSEWIDSFYARDILELFGIRNRVGFMKLLHLLLRQSGGLLDLSNLAKLSDLSRPTVKAHLEAMSIAHAVYLLSPFWGGSRREIKRQQKCYAFDTGFVTFIRGWDTIRDEDRGILWEHLVLDALRTTVPEVNLFYWRDKSGHEIDFVVKGRNKTVNIIECKINPDDFNPRNFVLFRSFYPEGKNFVFCPYITESFSRSFKDMQVIFCSLQDVINGNLF